MYRLVSKYYVRIYQRYMKESINLWKNSSFVKITSNNSEVTGVHADVVKGFSERIVRVKDQNVSNCELHFRRKQKFRLWKAWQETRF